MLLATRFRPLVSRPPHWQANTTHLIRANGDSSSTRWSTSSQRTPPSNGGPSSSYRQHRSARMPLLADRAFPGAGLWVWEDARRVAQAGSANQRLFVAHAGGAQQCESVLAHVVGAENEFGA